MKTLHLYVLRQALATLVMTVCVFALVLLLGNILREILTLLVNGQASFMVILKAIALLVPWIMAWVLPIALLTAMLLLFGRLSADNELTAIKASGISLLSLTTPLLLLALVLSAVCAWFNLKITPESRVIYKRLVLQAGLQHSESLIMEGRFIDEIPRVKLYIRKKRGDQLEDVWLHQLDEKGDIITRITAARARISWDKPANKAIFELIDGVSERLEWKEVPIYERGPALPVTSLGSTNLFQEILSNAPVARVIGKKRFPEWQPFQFGSTVIPVDLPVEGQNKRRLRLSEMSFMELKAEFDRRKQQGIGVTPILVQMHRQVAFSFASFSFTLVAIPLGIRAHRRETSVGMAISLGLALVYYGILILGEALQMRERMNPHLLVWIPNLLFQTLGAVLLWRANRKG